MAWRPRLVVRRGRGGSVSSPTTTAGYALLGVVASALAIECVIGAVRDSPWALLGLLISSIFLHDTWAWFAATDAERAAFKVEVARLGGGPDQTTYGTTWGLGVLSALLLWLAASVLLAYRDPSWLVSAMFALAVLVAVTLDRIRNGWRTARLRWKRGGDAPDR